jgi:hypothetical protein
VELPPHRPRQHGFIELIMVRLHPDTPDDLEIPILTLCSVLDQVVDEVPSRSILGAGGWPHTYNSSIAGYSPERLRWDLQAKCVHDG